MFLFVPSDLNGSCYCPLDLSLFFSPSLLLKEASYSLPVVFFITSVHLIGPSFNRRTCVTNVWASSHRVIFLTINTIYFNLVIQEGRGLYSFIVLSEACIISHWEYMTKVWNCKIEIGMRFIKLKRGRKFWVEIIFPFSPFLVTVLFECLF